MPMSAGRTTERRFTTTNGIHVISEKLSPVIFDSATAGIPKGDPSYYYILIPSARAPYATWLGSSPWPR
jgi:hypothetical protein